MNRTASAWLTLGADARFRAERLDATDFGIGGAPRYTELAARLLMHADLRSAAGPRAFLQFSYAAQDGRRPAPRPFDESRLDVAQAFIDLPVGGALTLRAGRQELDFDENRLVSLRDGATLRRAFDALTVDVHFDGRRLSLVTGRPVAISSGALDDRADRHELFNALSLDAAAGPTGGRWGLFFFDRSRTITRPAQPAIRERRETLGLRYRVSRPDWDLTTQGALQNGTFHEEPVRAAGLGGEIVVHPPAFRGFRVGFGIGCGSGDRKADDGETNTFDPIYPNLAAFSDAPLWYPANEIALSLDVSRTSGAFTLRADAVALSRTSVRDSIYGNSGRPLARPGRERGGAALLSGSARWAINPHAELYVSYVHAFALDGVRSAGGNDADFGMTQLSVRF